MDHHSDVVAGRHRPRRTAVALVAGTLVAVAAVPVASGHVTTDNLHGGTGTGVKVVGHSDLGGAGLNGHVAVLGDHAFVGHGTSGGTGFQWNKTPKCNDVGFAGAAGTVKVVSLANPSNPTVVATISLSDADPTTRDNQVVARDVDALRVSTPFFTGDLLAIARETCGRNQEGSVGVDFYDVTNPASPTPLGFDERSVGNVNTRSVRLVQRPDGRVLALEANQGGTAGGIHVADVTNPRAPLPVGTFDQPNGASSKKECRPFSFAQGASPNVTGSKAYAAYQDSGLFVLDLDALPVTATDPLPNLKKLGEAQYGPDEEGNSFRFVPNPAESLALATDEDLNPAKTTITVSTGPAAGTYRGCEAIWGDPLFTRATPSVTGRVVPATAFGCFAADYANKPISGNIALARRGGTCSFDERARVAQSVGATAMVISNAATDHHLDGTGVLFSPDSVLSVDAGVTIPVVMTTREAGDAIRNADAADPVSGVTATLADSAETWGALRVLNLGVGDPTQVATFNSPGSNVLTPGRGLYHAVNTVWDGNSRAFVAWMSDGFRVVDLGNPSAPVAKHSYVPPGVTDPTGNYGAVPLVVDIEKFGASRAVISDINGGLYVLDMVTTKEQCKSGEHAQYGFATQGACLEFLGF